MPVVRAMPNAPATVHEGMAGHLRGRTCRRRASRRRRGAALAPRPRRAGAGDVDGRDHRRFGLGAGVLRVARRVDDRGGNPARPFAGGLDDARRTDDVRDGEAAPRPGHAPGRAARVRHLARRHDDRRDPGARAGRRARGVPQRDPGRDGSRRASSPRADELGRDHGRRHGRGSCPPRRRAARRAGARRRQHRPHRRLDAAPRVRDRRRARIRLEPRRALVGRRALRAAGRPALELRHGEGGAARSAGCPARSRPPDAGRAGPRRRRCRVQAGARGRRHVRPRPPRPRPGRPHRLALPQFPDARRDRAATSSAPRPATSRSSTGSR